MRPRPLSPVQGIVTVCALGWSDFKLKYRASILGYFWSLVNPLVKFIVILFIFGPYVSPSVPQYPLYLFLGIIIWEHFATTTTACMNMLFEKSQIIRHLPFPRILLILSVGWTNLIIFTTHGFIFLLFAWSRGAALSFSTLYLVVIAIQMTLLALGVGMLLASYALRYRDLSHLWTVMVQILFWLTPVMYPYTSEVPVLTRLGLLFRGEGSPSPMTLIRFCIEAQPLSIIINDARRATLYAVHSMPTLAHIIGVTLVCCAIFFAGVALFRRRSPFFPQEY